MTSPQYQGGGKPYSNRQQPSAENQHLRQKVTPPTSNEADPSLQKPIDSAIMNVYGRVKNLENRYIDLANFYKEALVRHERGNATDEDQQDKLIQMTASPRGLSQSLEREGADSPGMKREDTVRENQMIRELINEKRQLEENIQGMKQTIHQCTAGQQQQEPLPQLNRQQLQQHLSEVFSDLFDCVDGTQVQSLSLMNSKQNAMFQMCTHHKLASAFRNESLGLWYDAKSDVTGCIAELKSQLIVRKTAFEAELGLNISTESDGGQDKQGNVMTNKKMVQAHEKMVEEFEEQFGKMTQAHQACTLNVNKVLKGLKQKETEIIEERAKSSLLLQEMNESLATQENIFEKRLQVHKQQGYEKSRQYESGKTRTAQNMSSFDRRLQSYQNTSITRGQRSSSRGTIPTAEAKSTSDNSSSINEPIEQSSQELRLLRLTLHKFGVSFDTYSDTIKQKSRMEGQLSKHINDTLSQFQKIIQHSELLLEKQLTDPSLQREQKIPTSGLKQTQTKLNSSRRSGQSPTKVGKGTPTAPKRADSRDVMSSGNRRPDSASRQTGTIQVTQQAHDAKVSDLNSKINQQYNDLRKEKDLYKELKKDNGRLRDQIISLKHNLDYYQQAQRVSDKSNTLNGGGQNSGRNLSKTQREDQPPMPRKLIGSSPNRATARQPSADKNVPKLAQAQTQEMANRVDHLCDFIQQFMTAMRQLQKAVNAKNSNLQSHKHDFERTKKQLEKYVVEVKGISKRQATDLTMQRQSSAPKAKPLSNRNLQLGTNIESENLNPHGGTTRAKDSQSKLLLTESSEASRQIQAALSHQPQGTAIGRENSQIAALLKQSTTLQAERQMMKKLIEELRTTVRSGSNEKEQMEIQLTSKAQQLARLQSAFTVSQSRSNMVEQILSEYRMAFAELESTATYTENGVSAEALSRVKDILTERENNEEQKLQEEVVEMEPNQDPTLALLRSTLVATIRQKSDEFESQMLALTARLSEKENDLQRVKLLFVDKLRELETSFVEISKDMIESDSIKQEEDTRQEMEMLRMRQQLQKAHTEQDRSNHLERSVENVLSKFEKEDREVDMENLTIANQELVDTIDQLRQQLKDQGESVVVQSADVGQAQMILSLNDQIEQFKHEEKEAAAKLKKLQDDDATMQKELKTQRYNLKSSQMSRKDDKERFESVKEQLQDALQSLRQQCMRFEAQMEKEYDARVRAEAELSKNLQRLKKSNDAAKAREGELEEMTKYIKNLEDEQKYERMLRESEDKDAKEVEKEEEDDMIEMELRIDEDGAKATASHYCKLAIMGKNECRALRAKADQTKEEVEKMIEETTDSKGSHLVMSEKVASLEFDLLQKNENHEEELQQKGEEIELMNSQKQEITVHLQTLESQHSLLTKEKQEVDNRAASLSIELETTLKTKDRELTNLMLQNTEVQRQNYSSRLAIALFKNLQNRVKAQHEGESEESKQALEVIQIQVKQLWDEKVTAKQTQEELQRQLDSANEGADQANLDQLKIFEDQKISLEIQVQEITTQSSNKQKAHETSLKQNKLAMALYKNLQGRLEKKIQEANQQVSEVTQEFDMIQVEVQNLNVQSTQLKLDHEEETKLQEKKFEATRKAQEQEKTQLEQDKQKLEDDFEISKLQVKELWDAKVQMTAQMHQKEQEMSELHSTHASELEDSQANMADTAELMKAHEEEKAALHAKIEQVEQDVQQNLMKAHEEEKAALNAKIEQIEQDVQQNLIQAHEEEKAALQEKIEQVESDSTQKLEDQVEAHQEELANFGETTRNANEKSSRENKLALALHKHLNSRIEAELQRATESLDNVQQNFELITIEVQNLNVQSKKQQKNHTDEKASLEKQIEALDSLKETHVEEKIQLEVQLQEVKSQSKQSEDADMQHAAEIKELEDSLAKAQELVEESEGEVEAQQQIVETLREEISGLEDQLKLVSHDLDKASAEKTQKDREISQLTQQIDTQKAENEQQQHDLSDELQLQLNTVKDLENAKDNLEADMEQFSTQKDREISQLSQQIDTQKSENEQQQHDLTHQIQLHLNTIKDLENAKDNLEADVDREKQNVSDWKDRMDQLTQDMHKGSQDQNSLEKDVMDKLMQINQLQQDKDVLEDEVAQAQSYVGVNKILTEQLEQEKDNLIEHDQQIKELQERLSELQGQKQELEESHEQRVKELQSQMTSDKQEFEDLQTQFSELEETKDNLQRDQTSQQLSYEILEQKKNSLESDLTSLEASHNQLQADHTEVKDDLHDRLKTLTTDFADLQTEKESLLQSHENNQESLNYEIGLHKETIEQQLQKIEKNEAEYNQLKEQSSHKLEEMKGENDELRVEVNSLKETIEQTLSKMTLLDGEKESTVDQISELRDAHDALQKDSEEQIAELRQSESDLQATIKSLQELDSDHRETTDQLQKQIAILNESHSDQTDLHQQLSEQLSEIEQEKKKLQDSLEVLQVVSQAEKLDSEQAVQSRNETIQVLKKELNLQETQIKQSDVQADLHTTKIQQLSDENASLTDSLNQAQTGISTTQDLVNDLSEQLKTSQAQLSDHESGTTQAFEQLQTAQEKLSHDKAELKKSKMQMALEQSMVDKMRAEAQSESEKTQALQESLEKIRTQLEEQGESLTKQEDDISEMREEKITQLKAENDELAQKLAQEQLNRDEEGEDLRRQISDLSDEIESLNEKIQELEEENDQVNLQLSTTTKQVSQKEGLLQQISDDLNQELVEAKTLESELLQKRTELTEEKEALLDQVDALTTEINDQQQQFDTAISQLEDEKAVLKSQVEEKEQVYQSSQEIYAEDMLKFTQTEEQLAASRETIEELKSQQELQTDKQQAKLQESFKKQEELLNTIEKLNLDKVQAMQDKQSEIEQIKKQLEQSGDQIKSIRNEAESTRQMDKEMEDLKQTHTDTLDSLIEQHRGLQEDLTRQLKQAEKKIEIMEAQLQEAVQNHMNQMIENDQTMQDLNQELSDQEALYIETQGQLEVYKLDRERLEAERDSLLTERDDRINELTAQLEEFQEDYNSLPKPATNIGEEEGEVEELKLANEQMMREAEESELEINQLRLQLLEQSQKMDEVQTKMPSERENSWERSGNLDGSQVIRGRDSWGSQGSKGKSYEQEIESHMQHVRHILEQFLCKLPISTKDNEDMLNIVYSMMSFQKEQINNINKAREGLTVAKIDDKVKKSIFGGFGRKK